MNIKHCLYYVFNYFGKCGIIKIFIYILIYMTKKVPKKEINKLTVSQKVTYIDILLNYRMALENPMFDRILHKSDTI